jgi:CBS domain-containing protein
VSFTATVSTSQFDIDVRFIGTVNNPVVRQAFLIAAAKWRTIIVGNLHDTRVVERAGECASWIPAVNEVINDVVIYARVAPIDGAGDSTGNILGQAGPCAVNTRTWLTTYGLMEFDEFDLNALVAEGLLTDVIVHEMGHVLGIGTLWDVQRALLSGSTAMSAALVAAGLVAALPLAAADVEQAPPSDISVIGVAQAIEAVEADPFMPMSGGDGGELWLGDYLIASEMRDTIGAEPSSHLPDQMASAVPEDRFEDMIREPVSMVERVEPHLAPAMQATDLTSPFAAPADQSLMRAVDTKASLPVEPIGAIVTNALEGQMVDLDALLGPQQLSEPLTPFLDNPALGEMAMTSPTLFIPEFMQVQIAAQMEHSAATGHA